MLEIPKFPPGLRNISDLVLTVGWLVYKLSVGCWLVDWLVGWLADPFLDVGWWLVGDQLTALPWNEVPFILLPNC